MVPLEMIGMVKYCHPPTPLVGLHRQSADPVQTKEYHNEARIKRDMVCFPYMLRTMTRRILPYRLIRRLWIRALSKLFKGMPYMEYLLKYTIQFIEIETNMSEKIPLLYRYLHDKLLDYDSINIKIRFEQMSDRLVQLGYNKLDICSVMDHEYYLYIILCPEEKKEKVIALYYELTKKGIKDKWRIILSQFLTFYNDSLYYDGRWDNFCKMNRFKIHLDYCIITNHLNGMSPQAHLLRYWTSILKYPSQIIKN
jgi:hypothetical protein